MLDHSIQLAVEKAGILIFLLPVFLLSLCVHEWAHAYVAYRRGDMTPVQAGRLSIMPWAHWDLFGTILLPTACFVIGIPALGWAKPVPVDARNFASPRRDMALVAFAGPLSNMIMAGLCTLLLAALHSIYKEELPVVLEIVLMLGVQANLALAFFNLLPVPPLDGFMIAQAAMPLRWVRFFYRLAPVSLVVLALLLVSGYLNYLTIPIQWSYDHLLQFAMG